MRPSPKSALVVAVLAIGALAALPFRKQDTATEPSLRFQQDQEDSDGLSYRGGDIRLQVPSSGQSPAVGLYVDEPATTDRPARSVVGTPSIGEAPIEPIRPPTMPRHYGPPVELIEGAASDGSGDTDGLPPDESDLSPIPPGSFGHRRPDR